MSAGQPAGKMTQVISDRVKGKVVFLEIIANTTQFYLKRDTAAAIGKFDGIHIGHRRLLEEILSRKKNGLAACVFTFDPSPAVFFVSSRGQEGGNVIIQTLNTREEKRLLFERMGVDILIEFPLNKETAAMSPTAFAEDILAGRMNIRFLAAGRDVSFGAKGAGNAVLLQELGPKLGFEFMTIDKVCMEGQEVSSTLVRSRVEQGRMEEVTHLLGMPYLIAGRVEKGNAIGRTIGFPTINICPDAGKLLPPNGVYFSQVRHRGKRYNAISNIGCKPTVSDSGVIGVESYLYDFDEEIYGEDTEIYLCAFHRPERRFESLEMLQRQLQEDLAAGAAFHAGAVRKSLDFHAKNA